MVSAPGTLVVVTVTHNSSSELKALLDSVGRHLPGSRVIVVDCGSSDQSVAVARSWTGNAAVVTVALEHNPGFGSACNRGLSEVDEPVTALLNPDAELLDASLLELAQEALRADRPERLLAPLVLSPDGSRQDTVHPLPASAAELGRVLLSPRGTPGGIGTALAPWRASTPRRVGWAVGCALVARTETLRRLGPFDERIFLFYEDLDLSLRAAGQGIETWFWPSVRVRHHGAHATNAAFGGEPFGLKARARHDVVARRLGARRARLDDATQTATFASRLLAKRVLGRPASRERRQLEAALHVLRGADAKE